jgi:hypothetical protein
MVAVNEACLHKGKPVLPVSCDESWPYILMRYQVIVTFLQKIPTYICMCMFQNGLSPKVNTIDDFISEAKRHETAKKMQDYYDKDTPSRMVNTMKNSMLRNDTN